MAYTVLHIHMPMVMRGLKALVNIVVDRFFFKVRTELADLYNNVQVDE